MLKKLYCRDVCIKQMTELERDVCTKKMTELERDVCTKKMSVLAKSFVLERCPY